MWSFIGQSALRTRSIEECLTGHVLQELLFLAVLGRRHIIARYIHELRPTGRVFDCYDSVTDDTVLETQKQLFAPTASIMAADDAFVKWGNSMEQHRRRRGRPPLPMLDPIPDTPENVARAMMTGKPKRPDEWRYMKEHGVPVRTPDPNPPPTDKGGETTTSAGGAKGQTQ